MQKHRRCNRNGVDRCLGKSFLQVSPGARVQPSSFCRIAGHDAIQVASGFGLNRWNNPSDRDIADSNNNPIQHRPLPRMNSVTGARSKKTQQKIKGRTEPAFVIDLEAENYFLGAIASLAALATRNFTTVLALIWMGSPVCGLRPTRALRCAFTSRPRPGTTNTPFFLVSLMAVSANCSRNNAAVLLLSSVFSARCRMSCVLVKPDAINFLLDNFLI